jgi:hypothetical protein
MDQENKLEEINIKDYNVIAYRKVKQHESFPIYYKKTTRLTATITTVPFLLNVENKDYLIKEKDFLLSKDENNNIVLGKIIKEINTPVNFDEYKGPIYDLINRSNIKFLTKKAYCKAFKFASEKYKLIEMEGLDNLPDFNEIFEDNEIKFLYKRTIYTAILSYIKHKLIESPNVTSHIKYLENGHYLYKRAKKVIDELKRNEIADMKIRLALFQLNENLTVV